MRNEEVVFVWFFLETWSYYCVAWNSICRPDWLQTHKTFVYLCLWSAGIKGVYHCACWRRCLMSPSGLHIQEHSHIQISTLLLLGVRSPDSISSVEKKFHFHCACCWSALLLIPPFSFFFLSSFFLDKVCSDNFICVLIDKACLKIRK